MRGRLSNEDALALGLIIGFGLFALAPSLNHPFIPMWDEGMHQAAARGTFDTPTYPHIYVDHLVPFDPRSYWASQAWLNKPPAPFWFAAAVMHVIGVTPVALRLASLLGILVAAVVIYLLGRRLTGPLFAAVAAVTFVSLPFTWLLVQGVLFGDVTDCTLVGCNALAIGLLVYSIERDSWRANAAAGLVVGVGILCKVMLAVTPLGVALVLAVLAHFKICKGPRFAWVGQMTAIALIVALPWNVYAAIRWPDAYWMHARTWLGHLAPIGGLTASIGSWNRPIDGIFNEVNAGELRPVPVALTLLAGVWLLVSAVVRRNVITICLAVWLWATWIVLSLSEHKVPATTWGVVPAVIIALALVFRDGLRIPTLGLAAVATLFTPWAVAHLPNLRAVRRIFPLTFQQTRDLPGLVEGICLALVGASVGALLTQLLRARRHGSIALAIPTALGLFVLFAQAIGARNQLEVENAAKLWSSHTREVGQALDKATPKRSVAYLDIDRDAVESSEVLGQIFWSGRMTYLGPPAATIASARERGYHPYLISPSAEAFAPVEGVVASAWLRAYDLERPLPRPAPIPQGVSRFKAEVKHMTVLGAATGPASRRRDRWAIYVESRGPPEGLRVVFHTRTGAETLVVPIKAVLREAERLDGVSWFILPTLGPKRADVHALEFDKGLKIPLPAEDPS